MTPAELRAQAVVTDEERRWRIEERIDLFLKNPVHPDALKALLAEVFFDLGWEPKK